MARRGEGPGCAAAGEVEGGEDRGCGLGFESQAHRHCSRAPSRGEARRERSGARCVCARGRAGRGGGRTDRRGERGGGAFCPLARGPSRPPRLWEPPPPLPRTSAPGLATGGCSGCWAGVLRVPAACVGAAAGASRRGGRHQAARREEPPPRWGVRGPAAG